MTRTRAWLAFVLALVLLGSVSAPPPDGPFLDPGDRFKRRSGTWKGLYAFDNVRLISMVPGERPLQRRKTVIVRNGIVRSIDDARDARIPRRAEVIDGRGRFLLPGLIDGHVHIWMGDGRYPDFDEKDLWTLFLANGVTGVLEMVGADPNNRVRHFLFDWRDDVAEGRVVGPTVFLASPRFRDEYQPDFATIDAKVKEYAELGYDVIKVHAPNRLPNYLRLFEQAEEHGIRPVGHPPYRSPDVPVETVLEHQTMVSHTQLLMYQYLGAVGATNMSDAQMDDLAAQVAEAGTLLQPTPATNGIFYWYRVESLWERASTADWLRYFPPSLRTDWVENHELRQGSWDADFSKVVWDRIVKQTRKMAEAGVPMIAGSDSGGIDLTPHGFFFHEELESLNRDIGLTGWETLEAATRNNAEFLRVGDAVGTIEVGKRADLLLVKRNPLRDIRNARRIAGVMVRGKWIPADRLQAALDKLAERMAGSSSAPVAGPPASEHVHDEHDLLPAERDGAERIEGR